MSTIGEQEMLRNQEAKQSMLHEKKRLLGVTGCTAGWKLREEEGRNNKKAVLSENAVIKSSTMYAKRNQLIVKRGNHSWNHCKAGPFVVSLELVCKKTAVISSCSESQRHAFAHSESVLHRDDLMRLKLIDSKQRCCSDHAQQSAAACASNEIKMRTPVIINQVPFVKIYTPNFIKVESLKRKVIKRALGSKRPRPTCPRRCPWYIAPLNSVWQRTEDLAQSAKRYSCRHEHLSLILSTHIEVVWRHTHVVPALESGDRDRASCLPVRDTVF